MEESEERDRRLAERATEVAETLNKSVITIEARTGEDERLFGSVTTANIADAIQNARGIHLDRRRIQLRAHKVPRHPPGAHPGSWRRRGERQGDRRPVVEL